MSIVEKMGTFHNETIHIMPKCTLHLHGHQNEMVPFMKPSIFADLSNPIYNYNMCVRLCVRQRFRVLIDWRNRPGQSDSANKKSPTKNRLCFLPRRA